MHINSFGSEMQITLFENCSLKNFFGHFTQAVIFVAYNLYIIVVHFVAARNIFI